MLTNFPRPKQCCAPTVTRPGRFSDQERAARPPRSARGRRAVDARTLDTGPMSAHRRSSSSPAVPPASAPRPPATSPTTATPSTPAPGASRRSPRWWPRAAARWPWTSTTKSRCATAVAAVEDEHGAVGALVNNAGYSQSGALEIIPLDDIRRQFETNVFGLIRMCQLVLPGMRRAGTGASSTSARWAAGSPSPVAVSTTRRSTRSRRCRDALRFEVQGFGVKVVLIEPGLIVTDFAKTAVASVDATADDGPVRRRSTRRWRAHRWRVPGPAGPLGGGPDAVAEVIRRALESRRPSARYRVTPSATLAIAQRRITPDRLWDLAMRAQFPVPKP